MKKSGECTCAAGYINLKEDPLKNKYIFKSWMKMTSMAHVDLGAWSRVNVLLLRILLHPVTSVGVLA